MNTSNCIQWLWNTSRGFRLSVSLSGAAGVLCVCTSLAFVWITKRLVDIATGHTAQSLTPYIIGMLACMTLQLIVSAAASRLDTHNGVRMKNALRHRLFSRLMESQWTGRERLHTGDVLNRLEEDVRVVTDTLCSAVPSTLVTLIQLIAAFCFLLMLEARLAWTLLAIMPAALLMSKLYMKRMRSLTKAIRTTDSRVQAHVQEHLQHRTLISTLEHTEQSTGTLATLQTTLMRQVMQRTDFSLFSRTAVQGGFAAGYATAFLWGVFGLQSGAVTFGMMTAFLQLVAQVQRPVVELSRRIPALVHTLTSVERLAELDHLPQEQQGTPQRLNGAIGIRMENVSFAYPDGTRQVIRNFSHHFTPGSLTAIAGETGAGKSTLIRLALALLQPDKGSITLYNKEKEKAVSPLTRCNLVYVPQGNTLMSGTIRDNLLLGNPCATKTELQEALRTAVAEFVFSLPDGLDTLCGEGGAGLSEGQAQRIAIARGLLRSGGILLLDEPTSALDAQTQQTLMQRLKAMTAGKTVLVITHSREVMPWADETVELKKEY